MISIQRVQDILLTPKTTWPQIAAEPSDIASIYRNYLIYLAAIPAVCSWIGQSVFGVEVFGVSVRQPLLSGLFHSLLMYGLGLGVIYLNAWIASLLAPKFGGEENLLGAFKLLAYAATAAMLGGVFSILPSVWIAGLLSLAASIYSLYLLYLGVPVLMKVAEDKVTNYTILVIVLVIVLNMLIGVVIGVVTGAGRDDYRDLSGQEVSIKLPGTDITIDTKAMEAASRRMEEASRKMEQAERSGDQAAMQQTAGDMLGAVLGGSPDRMISPDQMREFAPEELSGFRRASIEAQAQTVMGVNLSSVEASYRSDDGAIDLSIQDIGASPALAMGMAAWAMTSLDRETDTEIERVFQRDGISYRQEYQKDGSRSEWAAVLPNQVMVQLTGRNVAFEDLEKLVDDIDMDGLSEIKRPEPK